MNRYMLIALIVIIVILAGGLGFFIFQNQKLLSNLASSPTPSPQTDASPVNSPETSPTVSPSPASDTTIEKLQTDIEEAVNSGNYAGLKSSMTDQVEVILQATECCGPVSPTEAQDQMAYVNDGLPFDFDQTNPTIVNLKNKNPELAGKFIGISQGAEHLIAFGINAQNLITDIRMSVSYMLFSQ